MGAPVQVAQIRIFLSTPSVRRATGQRGQGAPAVQISIHALRTEGDVFHLYSLFVIEISIHALRTEGDGEHPATNCKRYSISIHALRTEGDNPLTIDRPNYENFYPRPPYGGRHATKYGSEVTEIISIHALRTEGDEHSQ